MLIVRNIRGLFGQSATSSSSSVFLPSFGKGFCLQFLAFVGNWAGFELWHDLMAAFFDSMAHFDGLMVVIFGRLVNLSGLMLVGGWLMLSLDGLMAVNFEPMVNGR